jgi:hypothetical protein
MNANPVALAPRREHGWWMGLDNMLAKENFSWWRTRRWWVQCLLWLVLLNGGAVELNIMGDFPVAQASMSFFMIAGLAVPIAAVSLTQDSILGERHAGTAAWVLSKPLRRPAFLLSKLIAYAQGFLVTGCLLPGAVLYLQLTLHGMHGIPIPGFAAALGLCFLNLLFYMTLTLMLATLFDGRGPILGITLGILLTGLFCGLMPTTRLTHFLAEILPWRFMFPYGPDNPLAALVATGAPLPTVIPLITILPWCLLFVGVAIWRMGREEF